MEHSFIDLGEIQAFMSRIESARSKMGEGLIHFRQLLEGDFWVFEHELEEEILGALVHVADGRVYAISEDVETLIESVLT